MHTMKEKMVKALKGQRLKRNQSLQNQSCRVDRAIAKELAAAKQKT